MKINIENSVTMLLAIVTTPLLIMNMLGWIVAGVWLAIIGEWGLILVGIIYTFGSIYLISIVLVPGILLLAGPGAFFLNKGFKTIGYAFIFLSMVFTMAVVVASCTAILFNCVDHASDRSLVPSLIWSYGVALSPWTFMTTKEDDGGRSGVIITAFAQAAYITSILMILFWHSTRTNIIITFSIIMIAGAFMESSMEILRDRRKRTAGEINL